MFKAWCANCQALMNDLCEGLPEHKRLCTNCLLRHNFAPFIDGRFWTDIEEDPPAIKKGKAAHKALEKKFKP